MKLDPIPVAGRRRSLLGHSGHLLALKARPLWTRPSCFFEKLGPVGRDALLRFGEVHSALSHLHCQEILDGILLLEEPLWERNFGRPALRPYVVQCVRPAEFQ